MTKYLLISCLPWLFCLSMFGEYVVKSSAAQTTNNAAQGIRNLLSRQRRQWAQWDDAIFGAEYESPSYDMGAWGDYEQNLNFEYSEDQHDDAQIPDTDNFFAGGFFTNQRVPTHEFAVFPSDTDADDDSTYFKEVRKQTSLRHFRQSDLTKFRIL